MKKHDWEIVEREPNTIYVASISYGKDSLAMLGAIKKLGLPLDRIISVQVWATNDIPADLPEMYEWKAQADKIIFDMFGLKVERVSATIGGGCCLISQYSIPNCEKVSLLEQLKASHKQSEVGAKNLNMSFLTYETLFYTDILKGWQKVGNKGNRCSSMLKGNLFRSCPNVLRARI
jgi:hypothetical protein